MIDDIVKKDMSTNSVDTVGFRQSGILSIEHVRPSSPDLLYRRFPVPWITLVISLGARGWWRHSDTDWNRFPAISLRGHGGSWSLGRDEAGTSEYIKILLDPCRLNSAFGIDAAEVVGATIDVSDIPQLRRVFEVDRLATISDGAQRVELVVEALANNLASRPTINRLFDIDDLLRESRVKGLAYQYGFSARSFRSQVRRSTGLTPKSWMRLARFAAALRRLHNNSSECGATEDSDLYFDQSHMIHEFRKFTGTTPAVYKLSQSSGDLRPYMMREKSL